MRQNCIKLRVLLIFAFSILLIVPLFSQETGLKKQAMAKFRQGDYVKAIELLEEAKIKAPKDAEIYYYLGYFSHYLAYDYRPLIGYNVDYSDNVLRYLLKAVELNPHFGNAYYFIGAEYGARAIGALQNEDKHRYKTAYRMAFKYEAFPLWLLEYGRNILNSCDKNAVLFVGGDAEFNPSQYLQVVEHFRTDVTVIPIALLDRPWYVETLCKGVAGVLKKAPLGFTHEQILNMHPYKWDTLTITIPISDALKNELQLSPAATMKWNILPDLKSDRGPRLSAGRAVLANIVETNKWQRPICFSLGCHPYFLAGLDDYFQLYGVVNRLLPVKTKNSIYRISPRRVEKILSDVRNIKDFYDVKSHDMPRVSNILLNYYVVLYRLAAHYKEQNQKGKIKKIVIYIKKYLSPDIFPGGRELMKRIVEIGDMHF